MADSARGFDEPVGNGAAEPDALEIPRFLKAGRAQPIGKAWTPSQAALHDLAKSRPDLTPALIQQRMVEFRTWCAETNKHTHNPDATWLGFMVKTHGQRNRNDQSDDSATSRGIDAAFARRSIRTG